MEPSKAQLELMQAWNAHHEQLAFGQHEILTKLIAWMNEIAETNHQPCPIAEFLRLVIDGAGQLRYSLET